MSSPEQHFLSAIGYFKYIQISNILTSHWCSQFCPKPELVAPLRLSISPPRRMNSDSDSPVDTRVQNISEAFRWGSWWRDCSPSSLLIKERGIKANSKPSSWRVIPYLKQDSTRFKMPEPIMVSNLTTHHTGDLVPVLALHPPLPLDIHLSADQSLPISQEHRAAQSLQDTGVVHLNCWIQQVLIMMVDGWFDGVWIAFPTIS